MTSTPFQRHGGFAFASKLVLAFYDRVIESDLTGPYFEGVDMRRLVDHQTRFVAQIMGGPAGHTNEALERAHAHLSIDDAAFDGMAAILEDTLEDFDIGCEDIRAILAEIERRRPWIVRSAVRTASGAPT
jgi:hemoglobin